MGSTLKGWEFIQETILSHDEDMIADFADDIDTLLVFVSDLLYNFPATPLKSFISLVCFLRY